jgi:hypothetical protein
MPTMFTDARPRQGVDARHLLEPLNRDWRFMVDSRRHDDAVAEWSARHHALASIQSLQDLDDVRRERAVTDELLLALIIEHQEGDALAGRVALQLLLPGLVNTARRCSRPDAFEAALAAAWARLSSFPADRCPTGVPGRILLDVLHEITEVRKRRPFEEPAGSTTEVTDLVRPSAGAAIEDAVGVHGAPDSCLEAIQLLLWARAAGVLTFAEATLLGQTYIATEGDTHSNRRLAAAYGITETCLRARQSRAVRRLAAAVRELAASTSSPTATAAA